MEGSPEKSVDVRQTQNASNHDGLTVCSNPRPHCDICNSKAIANNIASPGLSQMLIEGAIQTMAFGNVTIDRVFQLFGSITLYEGSVIISHMSRGPLNLRLK